MRISRVSCTLILIISFFLLTGGATVSSQKVVDENLAPDFKLQDVNKNTFSLSSYRDKQPVLLLFWTTWCPYCRSELKQLKEVYPQLIKEGWEIFAVNIGEAPYKVENFVSNYSLLFSMLLDKDKAVANSYNVLGIPTYILIDKKGRIVFKDHYFPQEEYKELISK